MTILSRDYKVTYKVAMDTIFKALADPARLTLLDSLKAEDGQSLQQLQGQLEMTRFGVMKHLSVLEDAAVDRQLLDVIKRPDREVLMKRCAVSPSMRPGPSNSMTVSARLRWANRLTLPYWNRTPTP